MDYFPVIPAKLLLFGEHSVLLGSPAITLPLWDFTAKLAFPHVEFTPTMQESNLHLRKFLTYLQQNRELFEQHIHLAKLQNALESKLYLESDIPSGYGLGSSASVCVAVYKAFGKSDIQDINDLKLLYSQLESFFHGKSSGIDPLAIHTQRPVIVHHDSIEFLPDTVPLVSPEIKIYLLDSHIVRNAGDMISGFQDAYRNTDFKKDYQANYLPVLEIIKNTATNHETLTWELLEELSRQQLVFFRKLIPDSVYSVWRQTLKTGQACFKILGAGGGGYFLIFSKEEFTGAGEFGLRRIRI